MQLSPDGSKPLPDGLGSDSAGSSNDGDRHITGCCGHSIGQLEDGAGPFATGCKR